MKTIEFWKMNGGGNDFILIDSRDGKVSEQELSFLVERSCRRRKSVGADGVIFVTGSDRYDFSWRFFNADGGEAEMCGNGGRCVSRFAYLKGIAGREMTFGTLAGPISATVDGRRVKVLMPKPGGLVLDPDIEPQEKWLNAGFINTGVPHVVVQVSELSDHPVVEQGRIVRYHERFAPGGTNADFMKVIGTDSLEIRTYERGVEDETLACGTGAIACALVASARELVKSPVRVKTRGEEVLTIYFEKDGESVNKVWMEGNTTIVYEGVLHEEAL
jgi:diaminopimelate epimerase